MNPTLSAPLNPDELALAARLWTALVAFEQDALEELEQAPPRVEKAVRVAIVEAVQQAVLQGGNPKNNANPFGPVSIEVEKSRDKG